MKKSAKAAIASILWEQVRRLRSKNNLKVVAVVGSIGKTSTKFAIARVLSQKYRVQFQAGNYNDIITVPLVFFGLDQPNIKNPIAWLKTIRVIKQKLKQKYPYDVVVIELGTDAPGQLKKFANYLWCDIAIVTAITPEHMENFGDLDAVAKEELMVQEYSDKLVINTDLIDYKYSKTLLDAVTFGSKQADYIINDVRFAQDSATFTLTKRGETWLKASMKAVAKSEIYSATAAAVIADMLGVSRADIAKGITKIQPVSGRMQRLKGIRNSLILDETYNASPVAVRAALDSLYAIKAPQKIAILGNMNELGETSVKAHREMGEYCDPNQLDLVVTIGPDANKYSALAARKKGCSVKTFDNPYDAGKFVRSRITEGAVILAKGSQNGVFAEEAVKCLLANPADAAKLVRQSKQWLKKKEKSFGRG